MKTISLQTYLKNQAQKRMDEVRTQTQKNREEVGDPSPWVPSSKGGK